MQESSFLDPDPSLFCRDPDPSFNKQKKVRKSLISTILLPLFEFLSMETDVNVNVNVNVNAKNKKIKIFEKKKT
jgi:hypothetical protein